MPGLAAARVDLLDRREHRPEAALRGRRDGALGQRAPEAHGRVDVFANLLEDDIKRLRVLIARHAKLTGSKRAAEILANWKTYLPKFRKIMPVEYRRALKEMKAKAEAEQPIAIGA